MSLWFKQEALLICSRPQCPKGPNPYLGNNLENFGPLDEVVRIKDFAIFWQIGQKFSIYAAL